MAPSGRTVRVRFLGDMSQLEASLARAGLVADDTSKKIAGSADAAGRAAAAQAAAMGRSATEQEAAAGRAAAAFTEASAKITRAQYAAGDAAAATARRMGESVDAQKAAYDRAIATQAEYEAAVRKAADVQKAAAAEATAAAKAAADAQIAATKRATAAMAGAARGLAKAGKFTLGAGIVGAAFSVKDAAQLQRAMEMLHTQAGASQHQVDALTKSVLNMAGAAGVGPRELADGMYHVVSSLNATLPPATRVSTELQVLKVAAEGARVGNANLVDVTNALDAAVVSGVKGVQNFGQAMGALNAVVGAGDMKMQDLADALGTGILGPMKTYGMSLRDVGAALAVFGDNNIRGQDAATKLISAVRIMAAPSTAAAKYFKALGMSVGQLGNDIRSGGIVKALTDLKTHLEQSGLTATQQGIVIARAFGGRQSTGVQLLLAQLERLRAKYGEVGAGAGHFDQAVAANNKTLAQQMDQLKATVQALADKFGMFLIPKLQATAQWVQNVIGWFGKHKAAAEALAAVIAGVLGAAVGAFVATKAVAMVNGIRSMVAAFGALGARITGTAATMTAEEGAMVATTEESAVAIDAALISTGVGAALVALGSMAVALQGHWGQVWDGIKSATLSAVNAIVDAINSTLIPALNGIVSAYNSTLGRLFGQIGNVGNLGHAGGGGGGLNNLILPGYTPAIPPGDNSPDAQVFRGVLKATSGAVPRLSGGSNEAQIGNFLVHNLGLPPVAAAGILGNLSQESGFNPHLTGASGLGIAQWMGSRRTAAEQLAASERLPSTDLRVQLQYLATELRQMPSLLSALKGARSPQQAADIFMSQFERPNAALANAPNRENQAAAALAMLTGGTVPSVGAVAGSPSPSLLDLINGTSAGKHHTARLTPAQKAAAEAARKLHALIATSNGLLVKLTNALQSGTVKTLTAALGVSTSEEVRTGTTGGRFSRRPTYTPVSALLTRGIEGLSPNASMHDIEAALVPLLTRAGRGSVQERAFSHDVAQLRHSGQGDLARRLVDAHKEAMRALAQEMYAEQASKDAESLNLQATQLRDQTQLQQNADQTQLDIAKATQQKIVDGMEAQVTIIRDWTQVITDKFSAMTQAIEDSTQAMSDANNAVVQGINDQTQIRVDILGERGLYGLNLIAQKLQVQADITKAFWDQQIATAQANLDATTATWHAAVAQAQMTVDQVQLQQDQLVAQTQAADDTVKIAQLARIAGAQAHEDAVTLHMDTSVVGPAQIAVDMNATAPKAVQDAMAAQLKKAQGVAGVAEGQAASQLQAVTSSANALMQAADSALAATQAQAQIAIGNAQQALATTQGEASTAIAAATATLTGVQGQAGIAEANASGAAQIAGATAQTQFAGGGLTVNMYGIPMDDATSVTGALDWFARNTLALST